MSDICLKQGRGMRVRAAPPHPGIYRVPPPPPGGNTYRLKEMNKTRGRFPKRNFLFPLVIFMSWDTEYWERSTDYWNTVY